MHKQPDRYSISELEAWSWTQPVPDVDDSSVVRRFHALHNVPIGRLSPDDLRFLIGQNACLSFLVPKALDLLEQDPWTETEYYPGDFLSALVNIDHPKDFWSSGNKDSARFAAVAAVALKNVPNGASHKELRLLEIIVGSEG